MQSSLESRQIDVDDVHSFLVHYFSRDDWIQHPSSFSELFRALSASKLWNYDDCGPLESIISEYLPDDAIVKALSSHYNDQLTGFRAATNLADYIKMSKFENSEQDPHQSLRVDFYKPNYRKLSVCLKLGQRKVSAITLTYVDELWRSLAKVFILPSLTAIIDSIIEGSLKVTWLILPQIAEKIIAKFSKAVKFFRDHDIIQVAIDDDILYNEEQMVS